MLLFDSIDPERWYKVSEAADILGWSHDMVERWIAQGLLQAFVIACRGNRKRLYRGKRVQGCEIIRFVKTHLTILKPRSPRFRVA
jgi:DNA-binding transcriptional MerR regulator